jgi:hypothetical protein
MLEKFTTLEAPMPEPDSDIRRVIRDHKDYLINHPTTSIHSIDPDVSYPERYNWYRYFLLKSIPTLLFYPIFVVNDITDVMSLDHDTATIILPSAHTVQSLLARII